VVHLMQGNRWCITILNVPVPDRSCRHRRHVGPFPAGRADLDRLSGARIVYPDSVRRRGNFTYAVIDTLGQLFLDRYRFLPAVYSRIAEPNRWSESLFVARV